MKTINNYIKDRRVRFMIKLIAAAGYVVLGSLWWIAYGIVTLLYRFVCDVLETLFIIMESLAAVRYKLQQLHHRFSYFEMMVIAISTIAILAVLGFVIYFLMFSFTVIIPTGY